MQHNKILFNNESIDKMKVGMDMVYRAVGQTLGAAGRNVIYRSEYSRNPVATNDGVTIAKLIHLEDEAESMGADYIKQAAERTNDEAGDGTSTAVVLAHAMVTKGLEKIAGGKNPMVLRREMSEATEVLIKKIKKLAAPVKTDEELFQVANLSMENPKVAKVIVEAVKQAGENGTVIVDESSGVGIEKEVVEGLRFERGWLSPYMITDPARMEAVLTDVYVLVTDKMFSVNGDIFHLLEGLLAKGVSKLFVVCENVQGELLVTLINNKLQGRFNVVVVQKPFDSETLEDIAVVTGGENLSSAKVSGDLNANHIASLGKAKKIIVTEKTTTIIGGAGQKAKIADRVAALKNDIEKTESEYRREMLRERIAKLVGGLVMLKVGAPTESDMKYMKLKVDDAVAATRAAQEEGIVAGGGLTLYNFSLQKPKNEGEEVVFHACRQPIQKIIENCGQNADEILEELGVGEIWDALTNDICRDPIKAGIIDPAKVERCSLKNATSMAATFLTHGASIIELPKKRQVERDMV